MNVRFPPTTVPVQPPGGEPVVPIRATNPCYPARSMAYPGLRGQRVHGAAQILRAVLGIDALRDARVGVAQDARDFDHRHAGQSHPGRRRVAQDVRRHAWQSGAAGGRSGTGLDAGHPLAGVLDHVGARCRGPRFVQDWQQTGGDRDDSPAT